MAHEQLHTWTCDGCDDKQTTQFNGSPYEWKWLELMGPGWASPSKFLVCFTCYMVLINNRRKGPTWLQRLAKCIGANV